MTVREKIEHVIFDFDGTCTDIPAIADNFLRSYFTRLNEQLFADAPIGNSEWNDALKEIRQASPDAGWTVAKTPSAPAGADPYILSFEAAQFLLRKRGLELPIPSDVYKAADEENPPPLRPELKGVLLFLIERGVPVTFISNSSTTKIRGRLITLFDGSIPTLLRIETGGAKYSVSEPLVGDTMLSNGVLAAFRDLPAAVNCGGLDRPVYLRRANYAAAISRTLAGDVALLSRTLFCGDIWEMDLAMPFHLGASIHFIERAAPFTTYPYEIAQITRAANRARSSVNLDGLHQWFGAGK